MSPSTPERNTTAELDAPFATRRAHHMNLVFHQDSIAKIGENKACSRYVPKRECIEKAYLQKMINRIFVTTKTLLKHLTGNGSKFFSLSYVFFI